MDENVKTSKLTSERICFFEIHNTQKHHMHKHPQKMHYFIGLLSNDRASADAAPASTRAFLLGAAIVSRKEGWTDVLIVREIGRVMKSSQFSRLHAECNTTTYQQS